MSDSDPCSPRRRGRPPLPQALSGAERIARLRTRKDAQLLQYALDLRQAITDQDWDMVASIASKLVQF